MIYRIDFEQFRHLKKSSLSLGSQEEPLKDVLLVGSHGSGKTTVLEAIVYGLGRKDMLVREMSEWHRQRFETVPFGGGKAWITGNGQTSVEYFSARRRTAWWQAKFGLEVVAMSNYAKAKIAASWIKTFEEKHGEIK